MISTYYHNKCDLYGVEFGVKRNKHYFRVFGHPRETRGQKMFWFPDITRNSDEAYHTFENDCFMTFQGSF